MNEIDELLKGSIDMHLHPGPDSLMERRLDAIEAATQARQAGMRAIVLKNHHYPTAALAIIVGQLVPGVKVFGSICLDYEIGGLNLSALRSSAKMGAKVVWMPTFSAIGSRAKLAKAMGLELEMEGEGISILDSRGKLVPEIERILRLVKEYDMVLATGHISSAETFALVEEAQEMGIWKVVITHANEGDALEKPLTLEEQGRLAKMGAFIEYTGSGLMPTYMSQNPAQMANAFKSIGAEHFIISSDLGQMQNPLPVEGLRLIIATLLRNGVTRDEVDIMARVNPAKLLGLDAEEALEGAVRG